MNHQQALVLLATAAATPGQPPGDLDAALRHASTCRICAARFGHLLAALRAGEEDVVDCGASDELLPEYLAALQAGRSDAPQWAPLRLHLVGCAACSAALAELHELHDFATGARGAEPPLYPAPRVAARPSEGRTWWLDDLGRLVVDLARALVPVQPALGGLKSSDDEALAAGTIAGAVPDLDVQLALEGQSAGERRTLLVTVVIPGRDWPDLAGSEVTLLRDQEQVAHRITDAFGTTVFADLPAAEIERYSVVVEAR
jgi:hypothetical protein